MDNFIQTIRKMRDVLTKFDDSLWASFVESVTVYSKDETIFLFKGNIEIKIWEDKERERQSKASPNFLLFTFRKVGYCAAPISLPKVTINYFVFYILLFDLSICVLQFPKNFE